MVKDPSSKFIAHCILKSYDIKFSTVFLFPISLLSRSLSLRRSRKHLEARFITHYIVASWVKPRKTGFAFRAAASISTTSNQNWRTRPAWPNRRSLLSSKITRIPSTLSQHSRLWSRTDNLRAGGAVPWRETKETKKIIDPLGSSQSCRYEDLTMPQCTYLLGCPFFVLLPVCL